MTCRQSYYINSVVYSFLLGVQGPKTQLSPLLVQESFAVARERESLLYCSVPVPSVLWGVVGW